MVSLSKSEEILLQELLKNKDNLSEFLKRKFIEVGKNHKEDEKLRSIVKELVEREFLYCAWADDMPYHSTLTHYAEEYFENKDKDEKIFPKVLISNNEGQINISDENALVNASQFEFLASKIENDIRKSVSQNVWEEVLKNFIEQPDGIGDFSNSGQTHIKDSIVKSLKDYFKKY